ncbi:Gtr1/RagA G protein conserved region-domain-containing protein [Podospora appendiculata]|uniref:GTP-binding protein n=1 Tax=Podospora appendiculata TaxID=314037 RepID=A0AAE0X4U0_9PEZI|nr:Gtr1/RagA G protein conserved region-domain-containing protein [Podospora appendiculata]
MWGSIPLRFTRLGADKRIPAQRSAGSASASGAGLAQQAQAAAQLKKVKKQKVLLMGKSGSGKSSMRSIIFSNYLARDTRRLGATIDIDLSHVKFLGNLTLNLWDCGGQEAFMENYLSQQRAHVFSNVGVLIYVFDIESRDVERDLATYVNIISALVQYSREAKVFVLIHKMDLIQPMTREEVFDRRVALVRRKTAEAVAIVRKQMPEQQQQQQQQQQLQQQQQQQQLQQQQQQGGPAGSIPDIDIDMQLFATSIWDQSLYKAWASIIHDLVPNLSVIEEQLASLGVAIDADEILLFERTSFLVVSRWTSPEGDSNPYGDRFERMSNILKSWKHTCSKFAGTPRNAEQFSDFEYKMGANFSMFVTKFTTNTYILVCMPPGEARFNSAKLNVAAARPWFKFLDGPVIAPNPAGASSHMIGAAGGYGGDYANVPTLVGEAGY